MPLLEIRDLLKSYRSPGGERVPVIAIPELLLDEAEPLALEGPSGSGKTTLLHLIAGILAPDAGSIRILGEELVGTTESRRDAFRARHLGYVYQSFNLLQGFSALENVVLGMAFGGEVDRDHARELLALLGLGDHLRHRPHQLSIGQQQRVALARALASRPRLVLADEPTGNLDAARALEAVALIRETCRAHGAALLLVSHDPAVLATFERRVALAELNRAARAVEERS